MMDQYRESKMSIYHLPLLEGSAPSFILLEIGGFFSNKVSSSTIGAIERAEAMIVLAGIVKRFFT